MKKSKDLIDYRNTIKRKIDDGENLDEFIFSIDDYDVGILELSVYLGDKETCLELLQIGINPNGKKGLSGMSPLILAIESNNIDIFNMLIKYRADVNQSDFLGITPLMIATKNQNVYMVKNLIIEGANINKEDFYGQSAYSIAIDINDEEIQEIYKKGMTKENIRNVHYNNFLFSMISSKNMVKTKDILNNQPDLISMNNSQGKGVLHIAVENDYLEIVPFLISMGANVYQKDNNGEDITQLSYQNVHLTENRKNVLQSLLEINGYKKKLINSQNEHSSLKNKYRLH